MISYEFALFFSAIAIIGFLIFSMKFRVRHKYITLGFLLIIYFTIVVCLTIFPIVYSGTRLYPEGMTWYNLKPFRIISEIFIYGIEGQSSAQIIGNIIMTMPFGVFVMILLKDKKWWKLLLFAVAFTVSIELTQLLIGLIINNMYRIIDIDDVILNVTGTYLGYLLYVLYYSKFKILLKGNKKYED